MPAIGGNETIYGRPEGTPGTGLLRVRVVRAMELSKKDVFGLSDPYCSVTLLKGGRSNKAYNNAARTRTVRHSLSPVWNEEFVFRAAPDNRLQLQVFDENRVTRDDFLGLVEIELSSSWIQLEVEGQPIREKALLLRPRSTRSRVRGTLRLAVTWLPLGPDDTPTRRVTAHSVDADRGSWELFPSSVTSGSSLHNSRSGSSSSIDATAGGDGNSTAPLPPGWEQRVDANGRTFYVNHNSRTTQWTRPDGGTTNSSGAAGVAAAAVGERDAADEDDGDMERRRDNFEQRWRTSAEDPPGRADGERRDVAVRDELHQLDRRMNDLYFTEVELREQPQQTGTGDNEVAAMIESSDDGGGPLPDAWEVQVAPNGRKFFIDHRTKQTTWVDPRTGRTSQVESGKNVANNATRPQMADDLGPLPAGWEERRHTDGRIFFIDHSWSGLAFDHSARKESGLVQPPVPKIDRGVSSGSGRRAGPKFQVKVRRAHVLEDSYRAIMNVPNDKTDQLRNDLWIEFDGELGYDYGGIAREWFFLLSHELFNPYYGLFEYSATDNYTLQINPHSAVCNEQHLSYYKFAGRLMGIAMYHGKLLDAFFIRPFYKMLLGKPIVLADMESVDNEYYNSLVWIADNDPEPLALTFTIDEDVFGSTVSRDLKPGGGDIAVTDENKEEYIQLIIKWRFVSRVTDQMSALTSGIQELIPSQLLSIFDANELELLLCGLQKLDVKDWKDHTAYKGGYSATHPVVHHFWKCVLGFDNETRCRLLQFATGTSRVPMNGFRELYGSNGPQRFTIERWGSPDMLPRAHTCFNRIDLPPYESYEDMKSKLVTAIENAQIFSGVD